MCFSTTEDDCSAGRNVLEINRKIYPRLFSSMFTLLGIQDDTCVYYIDNFVVDDACLTDDDTTADSTILIYTTF